MRNVRTMRYPHIAARIFNTPLLIQPQKLDAIVAGLGSRLLDLPNDSIGISINDDTSLSVIPAEMLSTKRGIRNEERGYKIVDGVAVIDISGITVHRTRMETMSSMLIGYNDITATVEHAMDNPDVHAILRVYDSPGGEVNGAYEHADRMRDLLGKKPMVSIADSLLCSSAYLAGSAADELVVSRTGYAGSIGVVMRHMDMSRALALEGVSVTHIYAGSHKIDGNPYQPLPDSVRAELQEEVDSLYEMFVDAVVLNRGISADAVRATEADTYRGQKAVDVGLADRVSTTDNIIGELAAKRSAKSYSISSGTSAVRQENAALPGTQQASTAKPISTTGVKAMTLEELRAAHPDVCAALVEEGRAAGLTAGAAAERQRIQDVEAQAMPGHEALITSLKFDGKTTGPEAAVQVLNAERAVVKNAAATTAAAAPAAATFAAAPVEKTAEQLAQEDANKPLEERAQADWDKSAEVRAEFGTFATYLAYRQASDKGLVKVAGKKKE
jgi:signal peptide peptidase SppA